MNTRDNIEILNFLT